MTIIDVMGTLHFLVIGAQKAGTTTLHTILRMHGQLWLPPDKEVPFFSDTGAWPDFQSFLADAYRGAPANRLWGAVSPQYMRGGKGISTRDVASRVATAVPDVKLIAVLRDPIERAMSEWRMASRRGQGDTNLR